jgi:acyl carrier protein
MKDERVRAVFLEAIRHVAPDVDLESLDPRADLRRRADLDSVDIANLVVALHEQLGVDVPESDYAELTTIDGAVTYLKRRLE